MEHKSGSTRTISVTQPYVYDASREPAPQYKDYQTALKRPRRTACRTRINGHKRERRSGACAIIYEAPQFCTKLRQFASCYTTHGAGRCARLATRSKTGIYRRLYAAAGKEGGGRAVLGHKRDEHVYYMRGTYCGSCAAFKTHEDKECADARDPLENAATQTPERQHTRFNHACSAAISRCIS